MWMEGIIVKKQNNIWIFMECRVKMFKIWRKKQLVFIFYRYFFLKKIWIICFSLYYFGNFCFVELLDWVITFVFSVHNI